VTAGRDLRGFLGLFPGPNRRLHAHLVAPRRLERRPEEPAAPVPAGRAAGGMLDR
jgi:hypothetical protein